MTAAVKGTNKGLLAIRIRAHVWSCWSSSLVATIVLTWRSSYKRPFIQVQRPARLLPDSESSHVMPLLTPLPKIYIRYPQYQSSAQRLGPHSG